MPVRFVVRGQAVTDGKKAMARELRGRMTEAEKALWQALRRNQIRDRQFRRQQVIAGYIVDFYCHSAALIVEVDGSIHDEQAEYDAERTQALESHGFTVLRFTNRQIAAELPSVSARIDGAIDASRPEHPNSQ